MRADFFSSGKPASIADFAAFAPEDPHDEVGQRAADLAAGHVARNVADGVPGVGEVVDDDFEVAREGANKGLRNLGQRPEDPFPLVHDTSRGRRDWCGSGL